MRRIVVEHGRAEREAALAIAERRAAAESHNRAVLAQATTALERDPAEALAWLASFDKEGSGWQSARALGLGALLRSRPDRIMPALSRDARMFVDGTMLVVWSARAMWVANLETQTSHTWSPSAPPSAR